VARCNRRALIRTISSINEPPVWHAQPHDERHSRALWCGAPIQDRRSGGSGYVASMVSTRDGVAQLFVVPPGGARTLLRRQIRLKRSIKLE